MKTIIAGALMVATVTFTACNSNTSQEGNTQDSTAMAGHTMTQEAASDDPAVAAIQPQFTHVDAKVAASFKTVVDEYLKIKNGLAADDATATAASGEAMVAAMSKVDLSLMTPEQSALYKENEEDLREHAEHIGKNAGDIGHQREHFAEMSADVLALVKGFGGGQVLYHDHCPMYNDNKGASWLSEVKDVKNPYFGSKMLSCGSVEGVIR